MEDNSSSAAGVLIYMQAPHQLTWRIIVMPPAEPPDSSSLLSHPDPTRRPEGSAAGGEQIAVISDIHSNLHALESVLAECRLRGITRFFCLGDIVGYAAFPVECLQVIQRLNCPVVIGNHDQYVGKGQADGDLNYMALAGVEYSIGCLSKAARDWISALPSVITRNLVTLVHASLADPLEWDYIIDDEDAQLTFPLQRTLVCFYGHTHVPRLFAMDGKPDAKVLGPNKFRLDPAGRYLINPGSVGQPRGGGDPRAQFLIFKPADLTIEFVRVEYNIDAAAEAILKAGLPAMLAGRLYKGI